MLTVELVKVSFFEIKADYTRYMQKSLKTCHSDGGNSWKICRNFSQH